jgi:hypothetical protein
MEEAGLSLINYYPQRLFFALHKNEAEDAAKIVSIAAIKTFPTPPKTRPS